MPTVQELREKRANVWQQMNEAHERAEREGRALNAEEQTKWDAGDADLDRLENEIHTKETWERRNAEMNKPDRGPLGRIDPSNGDAGDKTRNRGANEKFNTPEYVNAFEKYIRGGFQMMDAHEVRMLQTGFVEDENVKVQNALGVGTTTAGGYTVPLEFRDVIVETMKQIGSVHSVAETITTDSGVTLPWPTVDDTGNVGAILSENTQVSQQDVAFGQAQLGAWMYTSKMVLVSLQLLNDAGFAVNDKLPTWLGRRIGRIQNMHYSTGTGSSQPTGIVTGAAVGKTGATGQTTTIIYDDLIDMIDSIDAYYLGAGSGGGVGNSNAGDGDNPAVQWMMSQTVRRVVRKLKDSQNRPLWEPSLQAGTPDALLGYGIQLNNDMPTPAANAKSILFGDFYQGYIIRDVTDVQVMRLTERFADFLQVGFLAFARSDGQVQNTAAYKAYQHSAT